MGIAKMIIKIILGIFAYLLCGVATLELYFWRDRHCESEMDKFVEDDEIWQVIVVVFFPFFLFLAILYVTYKGLLLIIRLIRTLFTTIIYLIIALIKGEQ